MRKMLVMVGVVMIFAGLLSGCGKKEIISSEDVEFRAVGDTALSSEEQKQGLRDTAAYVKEYYNRIYAEAHADGAPGKAAKKIDKIKDKYESDINKYAEMDFADLSEEEIVEMNSTLCDLITMIREVDDIVTFGK